ncbi:MAG: acyltransferase, partial [Saccharopolyspora sp.]
MNRTPPTTTAAAAEAGGTGFARLPSLTGMRFVAAFLVFVHHAFYQSFFADPGTNAVLQRIGIGGAFTGVGFFFVLSGFVLTWSATGDDGVLAFWRRRLVKIYPNHLVTWLAGIALAVLSGTAFTAMQVVPNLFLLNVWAPDPVLLTAINQPSWSLCCELFFYLLFPWLLGLLKRIPEHRLWCSTTGLLLVIAALPFIVLAVLPDTPTYPGLPASASQWWSIYLFPPTRLLEFALGILVARIVRAGRWIPISLAAAFALLVVSMIVQVVLLPNVYGIMAPVAAPLALLIGAAATADLRAAPSPFRGRLMLRLGEL